MDSVSTPVATEVNTKWYTLRVVSGKEKKIKSTIEQLAQGSWSQEEWGADMRTVLLPVEKFVKILNGKKKSSERNRYPGYLFLEVAQPHNRKKGGVGGMHDDLRDAITNLPDVMHFLGKEKPSPLRQDEVEKMIGKSKESEEQGAIFESLPERGETIKINNGPFVGFNGVVDEVDPEKKKVRVTVKIFGRSTSMELSFLQIDRL